MLLDFNRPTLGPGGLKQQGLLPEGLLERRCGNVWHIVCLPWWEQQPLLQGLHLVGVSKSPTKRPFLTSTMLRRACPHAAPPPLHRACSSQSSPVTLPAGPFFCLAPGLSAVRLPTRGRSLVALQHFPSGALLFGEPPLVAAGDPLATASVCAACFLPVGSAVTSCACGWVYCDAACHAAAITRGHGAVCGGPQRALDGWCARASGNYPRVAAAALARSLSGDVEFMPFWAALQGLVTLPVAADADTLPAATHESYALVRAALSARMEGDSAGFWKHAFDVRTYARLMGTLRLNAFSIRLHAAAEAGGGREGFGGEAESSPPPPPAGCATSGEAGSCGTAGACGDGGGGCGSAMHESGAGGGTAVYAMASLLNHDCAPTAQASLHARAELRVHALRHIAPGEELTISYLGEAEGSAFATTSGELRAAAEQRRAQLARGYGFVCSCARCLQEVAGRGRVT